jgi:cytochrome c-type biogenesis protein CcmH
MVAIATGALLAPLLRGRSGTLPRAAYDMAVYRDQLAELDRDKTRGVITEAEAQAARAEIGRRMLAASQEVSDAQPAPAVKSWPRTLAVALAGAAPLAAMLLYLEMGSPDVPGIPFAEQTAMQAMQADTAAESRAQIERMLQSLAERVQKAPDDREGWILLARSLSALGRNDEALPAWRRVMALTNDAPEHAGPFGEALVQAAGGVVTPEARKAFERVREADPLDPRALFFLGIAQAQAGDARAALQLWTDIVATSPEDAPWLPIVRARITDTAREARIDPATIKPSPEAQKAAQSAATRGPGAAEVEAMQRLSPEERQAAIRTMVERLAARMETEPDNLEGWRRLGRAWGVLGERKKAKEALARAVALAPENVAVLSDYASALLQEAGPDAAPPAEVTAIMRRILALDPDHGDAQWFVGLAEAEAGNRDAAAALWEKLITRLPPGSPEYAEVKKRLDALKAAN